MQRQLAAAAERQAADRGHHRHARVRQRSMVLQLLEASGSIALRAGRHEGRQRRLQVGAGREARRCPTRSPGPCSLLGHFDGLRQAFDDPGLITCILVLRLAISTSSSGPDARASSFRRRFGADFGRGRRIGAEHVLAEQLALVDRQLAARHPARMRRVHEPSGVCTPLVSATGPSNTHAGSGALLQRLAGLDVFLASTARPGSSPRPARARTGPRSSRSPSASRSRRRARSRRSSPRCTAT